MPFGIGGEIIRHVATDAAAEAAGLHKQNEEKKKWAAIFAVFALPSLLIGWLRRESLKDADLLGGRATVERFMHTNVTALLVATLFAVIFIIVCFKTWRGRRSSVYQLLFTAGAAVIIGFTLFTSAGAVSNINSELKSPSTVTVEDYVLCTRGSDCILAFDEAGSSDSIVLVIPREKFDELSKGEQLNERATSRTWRLIQESEYTSYDDPVLYGSPLEITYFRHSLIFDSAELK